MTKATLVIPAHKVQLVLPVPLVLLVRKVTLARLVLPAHKVRLDRLVLKVSKV